MFSNLMGASPLALIALVALLLAFTEASESPYSGKTIAEVIASDPSYLDDGSATSNTNGTSTEAGLVARNFQNLDGKIFAASSNDSTGQGGYNITLPGNTCMSTVVGDFETPGGALISNATLGNILNAMPLYSEDRRNYTLTRALSVLQQLNTTLTDIVCAPPAAVGASRGLLFRYDPAEVEGFWSAFILGGVGVTGIAFAGLNTALIQGSAAVGNINLSQEVWILTAAALAQYIFLTITFRLQHLRYFSKTEAFVLNTFIAIGEGIAFACRYLWNKTCAAPDAVRAGVLRLAQATVNALQGFEPRRLSTSGMSSLNLVGQDIEQGQGGGDGVCS